MKKSLAHAVAVYLRTRRQLGFALVQDGFALQGWVRFAQHRGQRGPWTAQLALDWAQQPQGADRLDWASRLDIARRGARFWVAFDPRTEIPPAGYFGPTVRRRAGHVYRSEEITRLLEATTELGAHHPVRAATFRTLFGLLACTGLRIGEALSLTDADLDGVAGVLTIRHAKYGHARWVPLHSSTLEALQHYRTVRERATGSRLTSACFVTVRGQPLGYTAVRAVFRSLCRRLGGTQPPVPRLHDVRHTFAVRTLLDWSERGEPVAAQLWSLSTCLGHRHLADT